MTPSSACIALIKEFEGCHKRLPDGRLHAYPDPSTGGAPYTIGWGSTGRDVSPWTIWTQAQADARLAADVARFGALVLAALDRPVPQCQFDAVVSITFNVGPGGRHRDGILRLKSGKPSTLLRLLNDGEPEQAADEFLRWISKGSASERGLRRRRAAERRLFLGLSG